MNYICVNEAFYPSIQSVLINEILNIHVDQVGLTWKLLATHFISPPRTVQILIYFTMCIKSSLTVLILY